MSEGNQPLGPGDVFAGRYRVLDRIGAGGSSQVLRVEDQLAGQVIAIKILREGLANDSATIAQFRREVAIARQLIHPHIVRIHDIGEYEGLFYILMEYVDGRALSDMLAERGRFSLQELLPILSQFADAMTYVHSHGILHRDIKPNNILVDRHGLIKLMDFGIARVSYASGGMSTIVGTPAYMAPEQMTGDPVSEATDVFATGAMVYELLTGKRPFKGLGPMGRQKEQAPPAHTVAPDLPPGVSEVLERSMTYRQPDRHQSIGQFVADLRQFAPRSVVRPTREVSIPEIDVAAAEAAPTPTPRSGRTLADLLTPDPPELTTALRLLRRVLTRLKAIHAEPGHARDLSPDRIAIADDGSVGIDWTGDSGVGGTTLAASDPKYSAPESFTDRGLQNARDRQLRDVYVLGMIACEMLLGKREFERQFQRVAAEAPVGWMRWHLDPAGTPPVLSSLRPEVPASISSAVASMLSKDPSKRPSDLGTVTSEIDCIVDRLDQTAPQTMRTREVVLPAPQPEPRRTGVPRVALVLLALLLAGGLAGAAWWFLPPLLKKFQQEPMPSPPPLVKSEPPKTTEKKVEGNPEAPPQSQQEREGGVPMIVDPQLAKSLFFPSGDMTLIGPVEGGPTKPYYIDRYEVSNAAYRQFCQATRRRLPAAPEWDSGYPQKENFPVLNISWKDAAAFAAWAGKRLPTEQEWEHAARGPQRLQFPWGSEPQPSGANLAGADDHRFTSPPGAMYFDISPFGIADMLGNASEWVADGAPEGFHLMKGSNFTVDPPTATLSRGVPVPDNNSAGFLPVGFRCALDAEKAASPAKPSR